MKSTYTFKDIIHMFETGKEEGISATGTLKIVGVQLIHYSTPIAERTQCGFLINNTRYSLATGQLQKQLRTLLPEEKQTLVRGVPVEYKGSLKDFLKSTQ